MPHVTFPCVDCVCLAICKSKMQTLYDTEITKDGSYQYYPNTYMEVLEKGYIIRDYIAAIEGVQDGLLKSLIKNADKAHKRKAEFITFMVTK